MADIEKISTPAVFIITPSSRFNRAFICAYLSAQTASWAENCASRFILISRFHSCFDFVWAFEVAITHQVIQYLDCPLDSPVPLYLCNVNCFVSGEWVVILLSGAAVDSLPRHGDGKRVAGLQKPQYRFRCWLHWASELALRPAL